MTYSFSYKKMDNDKMKQKIDDYSFTVIQSNTATQVQENSHNVMASGYHRVNGIADTSQLFYRLYQNGEKLPCDPTVSFSCVDGDYSDYEEANYSFGTEIRSGQESTYDTTHYIFGDYWYTNDLRDEFSSVATHIHRTNTRLAMITQLLSDALTEEQIVQLYDDLIGMEGYYHVQDYNGLPVIQFPETTKFVISQSTIDFIRKLEDILQTIITTEGNRWVFSVLQLY